MDWVYGTSWNLYFLEFGWLSFRYEKIRVKLALRR